MKREVAFFKDKRAKLNSGAALIAAMRAVGMTDDEIKTKLLRLKAEKDSADNATQESDSR